jgi:hypothetical protein
LDVAIFTSSKMRFRSDADQMENKSSFIEDEQKASKRVLGPLRGFIESSFDNPTFSFYSPKKAKG